MDKENTGGDKVVILKEAHEKTEAARRKAGLAFVDEIYTRGLQKVARTAALERKAEAYRELMSAWEDEMAAAREEATK
jgi:hypothetical protein